MKIFFQNYGCKLNLAELQEIKISALESGYQITNQISQADLILINACNVTSKAFEKTCHFIKKNGRDDKKVIITGCLPPSFTRQKHPKNFFLIPSIKKQTIPILLKKFILPPVKPPAPLSYSGQQLAKTRSFIKIQSGCNTRCSYCVIPFHRGKSVSVSPDKIVQQIDFYVKHGYQEIVITGTNLGQYEYQKYDLKQLIDYIVNRVKIPRLRVSSIDASDIDDELLDLYNKYSNIVCPHFHLALQSGSDDILQSMRRPYSVAQYLSKVDKIYRSVSRVSITTDVIVGFPGESERDVDKTIQVIKQAAFLKVHLFSYSNHPQTDSSKFDHQISDQDIKKRYQKLLAAAENSRHAYFANQIGKTVPVLIEQIRPGDLQKNIYRGYSDNYLPVHINSIQPLLPNRIYPVKIKKIVSGNLIGEICDNVFPY